MRAFVAGRIGLLGLVFAVLPLALALSPALLAATLPIVLAALVSATGGLLGLRYLSARMGAVSAATGLVILGLAPMMGGLSGLTAGAALVALALDAMVLPAALRRDRLVLPVFAGTAFVLLLVAQISGPASQPMLQSVAALALLPLAALVTLALSAAVARAALEEREAAASSVARRDAIMIAAADVAVAVVDRGTHAVDVSDVAARLLATTPQEIAGRGLIDRVLIADRPALLKAVSDAAASGQATDLTLRLATFASTGRAGPPSFAPFAISVRPVADGSGHVALRLMPAAAPPRAVVNRTALFATLSHEVRTPMNAILGFSEILANPALQPKTPGQIAEYAGIIHRSAHDAFAVTRAVVDLLRVESPDFAPAPEWIDVRDMAGKIISGLGDRADCATCTVEAAGQSFEVEADSRALRMLLSNLIEGFANAGGAGATLLCRIAAAPRSMAIDIRCTPAGPTLNRLGHAAYLGVIEALTCRIAELCGADVSLALGEEGDLHAALRLPVAAATVMPLRDAQPLAEPTNIQPIRRSA